MIKLNGETILMLLHLLTNLAAIALVATVAYLVGSFLLWLAAKATLIEEQYRHKKLMERMEVKTDEDF